MSRRDPEVVLRQMRDHAVEVEQFTAGRQRQDLESDRMFQLAILHLLQIVGEAANRMPEAEQSAGQRYPGPTLSGFDIAWRVCRVEIPALIAALDRLLADDEGRR